ncbi:ankyrin repeat-containing domain protein [Mycena rebaudengoi]|nr:ankyrin repeat-containing domain protein [Mycena rebaudengoi]
MDPVTAVGLVASILQLVAAAKSVLDLGRDALKATKDQRDLLLEVANLAPLLEDLKHRVQQPNNQSVNGIQKLETPLGQLKETMEHINRKLGSANKVGSKALMWAVWSKKEVDADLTKIERFKAVLNAWLLLDNWDVGQQQEKNYGPVEREKIVKERKEIFDWLSPPNFFARQADIFETRQQGTGLWFLCEKKFQGWLSLGGTLWCRGIPGAGKTVLMFVIYSPLLAFLAIVTNHTRSIVVDYLRNHFQGNNNGVAVAYLNHKESDTQSPSNILAGLWWQLIAERIVSPMALQLYQKHQNRRTRPSLDEVREILRSTVTEYSKVFMIVDALDEYPEAHRYILLDALAAMGESVSLMLTSRPNIAPEAFFPSASVLKIHATDEDIRRYVKGQIQNSFRLSKHAKTRPELHEEIETKIAKNADGMFLIAKLHIDSLATKSTVKAVRTALQNLPEDLEQTYDEAMERINAQNKEDREIARRTLIWVANAKRSLTVVELQEALAIDPDSKALDADGLLDIEIILSVCVGLVIVDVSQYSRIVRLVHLTIQEYLDRVQPIRFPGAQTEITRHCLAYISYNDPRNLYEQRGLLLSYASSYCLLHASGEPELVLQDSIIQFLGDWWQHRQHPYMAPPRWCYADGPPAPSKLLVAALFGLQEITRHLLDSDKSISKKEKDGALNVALHWKCSGVVRVLIKHDTNGNTQRPFIGKVLGAASKAGHMETVQLLLENGADVNTQGGEYGTALQMASVEGNSDVVRLLLKHGANVNLQGAEYGTALQAASWGGSMEVVQLLLENGADVNLQGGKYGTALQAASAQLSERVVRLLLENGADVNLQGGEYGTALQAASAQPSERVARLLLENGADVDLQGGEYGTALQAAFEKQLEGVVGVVLLLLKHGADVNLQGGEYGTALQAASAQLSERVVRLLLENGADVNLQGGKYGTALQAAFEKQSEGVVLLLLKHGADVNLQVGFSGNALQAASQWGNMNVVQMLLVHGADVDAQGGEYGTALQAASAARQTGVVQLLLEHNADVNTQGGHYGTALQAASAKGCLELVQLLLEHNADLNLQGGKYGTALLAASAKQSEGVVRLLLKHGADVNAQGGCSATALQAASLWKKEMVQVLLENGANVNTQGGYYGTALQAALSWKSNDMVQVLLENGADVNLQGGYYGNALQAASAKRSEGVVRLLLKHSADVNMQGGYYGNALQAASWGGSMEVVQLLLENGADVNAQGGEYETALQAASWGGSMGVVQLLLENGADVNLRGGYGTALQAASRRGSIEVVQLLLEHGADVNTQGGYYGNALQAASRRGSVEIVQLLLKHGADVNAQGGYYGNALQAASRRGSMEIVQLLLKHGADVNARGGKYGTTYRAAKLRGRTEVVKLLIAHGADTDLAAEPGS